MGNRNEFKFSDFVTINPLVKLKAGEEYSFIEMKDLNDGQRNAYPTVERKLTGGSRFEEGDTLFARITPCLENGKICRAKGLKNHVGFGSTEFLVFRGKKDVSNSDFVFYLSRWDEVRRFAELNMVGTSGRQRVPKEAFDNLLLNLPSDLPTQTRIASILSALDDKIELNRQMNQTLEQMAQALFKKYFVDDIDPDNLPEGWRRGKLGEMFYHSKEGINPGSFPEKTFDHYSIPAYDEGCKPLPELGATILSNKTIVKSNSILFSKLNPRFPRIWLIENVDENISVCSTEFLVFVPNENSYSFSFLFLKQEDFKSEIVNKATGTSGSHQRIRPDDILNLDAIIPPNETLKDFEVKVRPLLSKIVANIQEGSSIVKLRDTLLPKLMSGEIEVNAEVENEVFS